MRKFNTTGLCVPERHYMVDISGRVEQVRAMIEQGDYFTDRLGRYPELRGTQGRGNGLIKLSFVWRGLY